MSEPITQEEEEKILAESLTSMQCTVCDRKYEARSKLLIHMRSHTQQRPYGMNTHFQLNLCLLCTSSAACESCDRAFTVQSNLKRHMRTVHTSVQPYSCRYCDKRFNQRCNVRRHEANHKRKNIAGLEIPPPSPSQRASRDYQASMPIIVPLPIRPYAAVHNPVASFQRYIESFPTLCFFLILTVCVFISAGINLSPLVPLPLRPLSAKATSSIKPSRRRLQTRISTSLSAFDQSNQTGVMSHSSSGLHSLRENPISQ